MEIQKEVKIYMQMIRLLDESTNDYLYVYDLENEQIYFTDKICDKYPLPHTGETGISLSTWARIIYPKDLKRLEENLEGIRSGSGETHNMEYRLIDREGNKVWVNCRGRIERDEDGRPRILLGSVSELAAGHWVDSLTGLWNYEKFMEDTGKTLRDSSGYLMVLGIDNFKHINVKNGRTFGNYILKMISEVLESYSDYPMGLYRLTGDCFAVNFPEKSREEVLEFYHFVKKELRSRCTFSAGVVAYERGDAADGGTIYQYAENALDRAKKEGKDMLIFFSPEDYRENLEQIELLDEMKASVREDFKGFYLCYQPQIDNRNFELYGVEALLRYQSERRGVVGPGEFIPLLEHSGLICEVGLWVLKTAVEQCAAWKKQIPNLHVNVNISYVQLRKPGITEEVLEVLEEAGVAGEALTLEVTESMQLQDYPFFNKIFYEWKRHGIQIAIDDFGTGYSSLSYLKSIDIDETKIDRSFVSRIQHNTYNYRLLSNMIELAHSAQIRVCCESVETEGELAALKELRPDVLQGFLFAKPYSKEEFEQSYMRQDSELYRLRREKEERFRRLGDASRNKQWEPGDEVEENSREILDNTELGLWRILLDEKSGRGEMYADRVMNRIMGVREKLEPEECYLYWYNRINDGYYHYVNLAVENVIKTGRIIQVEYTWNHPEKGEVTVRCMAVRTEDRDGKVCLEGYHRVISNLERPDFLPGGMQCEIFEYNEKKRAVYFHTRRELIAGVQKKEDCFPECWIEKNIVHPHFSEEFRSMFRNVRDKREQTSREMLFRGKSGAYEWFKIKTGHLSEKEQDVDTIAVILEPADQGRATELELIRKTDFYEALLSETAGHMEVDVESGHIMQAGGLWEAYAVESREKGTDFDQVVQRQVEIVSHPEDEEAYRAHLNLRYMKEMYQKGLPTTELMFRRRLDGKFCWMKLVLHVFQDRFTENMYALLYLKNIDAEKRRELAQENAAQRDPLTNVYNRSIFEEEAERFMEEEGAAGALIILDLDNFKQVNDRYGHLKGDEMLKALVKILQQTFRRQDLIGRLGGDEFLVFVKEIAGREVLDKRMRELFDRMEGMQLACSAGISMADGADFSYGKALKEADIALYRSKQNGKKRYSYYEKE